MKHTETPQGKHQQWPSACEDSYSTSKSVEHKNCVSYIISLPRRVVPAYPVPRQTQNQAVGDYIRDPEGVKEWLAVVAVLNEIHQRSPKGPKFGPTAEHVGKEEARCPDRDEHDEDCAENVKGAAGEDASVEVKDRELDQAKCQGLGHYEDPKYLEQLYTCISCICRL